MPCVEAFEPAFLLRYTMTGAATVRTSATIVCRCTEKKSVVRAFLCVEHVRVRMQRYTYPLSMMKCGDNQDASN